MSTLYALAVRVERALRALARPFEHVAGRINGLADCFAICPDCGRNRYTGAPCKNV